MKKILSPIIVTLGILAFSVGSLAFGISQASANFAATWTATSTTQGWIFPTRINGTDQSVEFKNFIATSTSATSTISTGGLAVGTSQFVVQQGSGNVGIGTTSPAAKLTVSGGAVLIDNNQFYQGLDTTGTARNLLGLNSGNNLSLGGTAIGDFIVNVGTLGEALRVKATSGNVGVGTTTPDQLLSIYSATTPSLEFSTGAGGSQWTAGIDTADGGKFKIASSTAVGTNTRLTIDGNGFFGFNTNTPGALVDVRGGTNNALRLHIANASPFLYQFYNDTKSSTAASANGYVDNNGNYFFGTQGATALAIYTNGTSNQRLYIDSSGHVGINTSTPNFTLEVQGTASTTNLYASYATTTNATTTNGFSTIASSTNEYTSQLGVASSTPTTKLSVGSGAISVAEYQPATSTSMTIDWRNGNQQDVRIGTSATTIGFSNYIAGQHLTLLVCNPASGTGGAVTFTGVLWPGGTAPTTTTTANKCDIVTLLATNGTSTLDILGGYNQNY